MPEALTFDDFRQALTELEPGLCRDCPMLNVMAVNMAELAVKHEVDLEEVSEEFRGLVDEDCPGWTLKGSCGTKKKVCHHSNIEELQARI